MTANAELKNAITARLREILAEIESGEICPVRCVIYFDHADEKNFGLAVVGYQTTRDMAVACQNIMSTHSKKVSKGAKTP